MSNYIDLTQENFESTTKEGIALVDFWAPWCGPCRMLSPLIDQLAQEFEGRAKVCKVNADEEQDLLTKYGVRSVPTVLFLKDGEVVDQLIGAGTKDAYANKINALL